MLQLNAFPWRKRHQRSKKIGMFILCLVLTFSTVWLMFFARYLLLYKRSMTCPGVHSLSKQSVQSFKQFNHRHVVNTVFFSFLQLLVRRKYHAIFFSTLFWSDGVLDASGIAPSLLYYEEWLKSLAHVLRSLHHQVNIHGVQVDKAKNGWLEFKLKVVFK